MKLKEVSQRIHTLWEFFMLIESPVRKVVFEMYFTRTVRSATGGTMFADRSIVIFLSMSYFIAKGLHDLSLNFHESSL